MAPNPGDRPHHQASIEELQAWATGSTPRQAPAPATRPYPLPGNTQPVPATRQMPAGAVGTTEIAPHDDPSGGYGSVLQGVAGMARQAAGALQDRAERDAARDLERRDRRQPSDRDGRDRPGGGLPLGAKLALGAVGVIGLFLVGEMIMRLLMTLALLGVFVLIGVGAYRFGRRSRR